MKYLNNNLYIIKGIILIYFGFVVGRHIGFREGVALENFDRNHANKLLQQCLRIVRHGP